MWSSIRWLCDLWLRERVPSFHFKQGLTIHWLRRFLPTKKDKVYLILLKIKASPRVMTTINSSCQPYMTLGRKQRIRIRRKKKKEAKAEAFGLWTTGEEFHLDLKDEDDPLWLSHFLADKRAAEMEWKGTYWIQCTRAPVYSWEIPPELFRLRDRPTPRKPHTWGLKTMNRQGLYLFELQPFLGR